MIIADSFEIAFKEINKEILYNYDYENKSRTGNSIEKINLSYQVNNVLSYKFDDEKINKISYDYAEKFFDFMISGGTYKNAEQFFENYTPQIKAFVTPPKSDQLPDNFNTLYGPRILNQLQILIEELKNNPNSRRGTIVILNETDQILLNKDESIEYPCTINMTYFIRNNKLNCHCNMRSQNTAVVMQLDMYLQARLLILIAEKLKIEVGIYTSNLTNAHIFERDFDYVKEFIS